MLVDGDAIVIGGGGGCDVVLTDATVAPRHVLVIVQGDRVIVEDLKTGHTYRDGRTIAREDLTLDDSIRIGDTVLELELADIVPAPRHEPWPETLSATELGLLAKLRADPSDEAARQIYADWLEAEGHHLRATFVRRAPDDDATPTTSELFGLVVSNTELAWRAVVGRGVIARCPIRTCPRYWHHLRPIAGDDRHRRCDACAHFVGYTDDGVSRHQS